LYIKEASISFRIKELIKNQSFDFEKKFVTFYVDGLNYKSLETLTTKEENTLPKKKTMNKAKVVRFLELILSYVESNSKYFEVILKNIEMVKKQLKQGTHPSKI
jgi:hypothetical protein